MHGHGGIFRVREHRAILYIPALQSAAEYAVQGYTLTSSTLDRYFSYVTKAIALVIVYTEHRGSMCNMKRVWLCIGTASAEIFWPLFRKM